MMRRALLRLMAYDGLKQPPQTEQSSSLLLRTTSAGVPPPLPTPSLPPIALTTLNEIHATAHIHLAPSFRAHWLRATLVWHPWRRIRVEVELGVRCCLGAEEVKAFRDAASGRALSIMAAAINHSSTTAASTTTTDTADDARVELTGDRVEKVTDNTMKHSDNDCHNEDDIFVTTSNSQTVEGADPSLRKQRWFGKINHYLNLLADEAAKKDAAQAGLEYLVDINSESSSRSEEEAGMFFVDTRLIEDPWSPTKVNIQLMTTNPQQQQQRTESQLQNTKKHHDDCTPTIPASSSSFRPNPSKSSTPFPKAIELATEAIRQHIRRNKTNQLKDVLLDAVQHFLSVAGQGWKLQSLGFTTAAATTAAAIFLDPYGNTMTIEVPVGCGGDSKWPEKLAMNIYTFAQNRRGRYDVLESGVSNGRRGVSNGRRTNNNNKSSSGCRLVSQRGLPIPRLIEEIEALEKAHVLQQQQPKNNCWHSGNDSRITTTTTSTASASTVVQWYYRHSKSPSVAKDSAETNLESLIPFEEGVALVEQDLIATNNTTSSGGRQTTTTAVTVVRVERNAQPWTSNSTSTAATNEQQPPSSSSPDATTGGPVHVVEVAPPATPLHALHYAFLAHCAATGFSEVAERFLSSPLYLTVPCVATGASLEDTKYVLRRFSHFLSHETGTPLLCTELLPGPGTTMAMRVLCACKLPLHPAFRTLRAAYFSLGTTVLRADANYSSLVLASRSQLARLIHRACPQAVTVPSMLPSSTKANTVTSSSSSSSGSNNKGFKALSFAEQFDHQQFAVLSRFLKENLQGRPVPTSFFVRDINALLDRFEYELDVKPQISFSTSDEVMFPSVVIAPAEWSGAKPCRQGVRVEVAQMCTCAVVWPLHSQIWKPQSVSCQSFAPQLLWDILKHRTREVFECETVPDEYMQYQAQSPMEYDRVLTAVVRRWTGDDDATLHFETKESSLICGDVDFRLYYEPATLHDDNHHDPKRREKTLRVPLPKELLSGCFRGVTSFVSIDSLRSTASLYCLIFSFGLIVDFNETSPPRPLLSFETAAQGKHKALLDSLIQGVVIKQRSSDHVKTEHGPSSSARSRPSILHRCVLSDIQQLIRKVNPEFHFPPPTDARSALIGAVRSLNEHYEHVNWLPLLLENEPAWHVTGVSHWSEALFFRYFGTYPATELSLLAASDGTPMIKMTSLLPWIFSNHTNTRSSNHRSSSSSNSREEPQPQSSTLTLASIIEPIGRGISMSRIEVVTASTVFPELTRERFNTITRSSKRENKKRDTLFWLQGLCCPTTNTNATTTSHNEDNKRDNEQLQHQQPILPVSFSAEEEEAQKQQQQSRMQRLARPRFHERNQWMRRHTSQTIFFGFSRLFKGDEKGQHYHGSSLQTHCQEEMAHQEQEEVEVEKKSVTSVVYSLVSPTATTSTTATAGTATIEGKLDETHHLLEEATTAREVLALLGKTPALNSTIGLRKLREGSSKCSKIVWPMMAGRQLRSAPLFEFVDSLFLRYFGSLPKIIRSSRGMLSLAAVTVQSPIHKDRRQLLCAVVEANSSEWQQDAAERACQEVFSTLYSAAHHSGTLRQDTILWIKNLKLEPFSSKRVDGQQRSEKLAQHVKQHHYTSSSKNTPLKPARYWVTVRGLSSLARRSAAYHPATLNSQEGSKNSTTQPHHVSALAFFAQRCQQQQPLRPLAKDGESFSPSSTPGGATPRTVLSMVLCASLQNNMPAATTARTPDLSNRSSASRTEEQLQLLLSDLQASWKNQQQQSPSKLLLTKNLFAVTDELCERYFGSIPELQLSYRPRDHQWILRSTLSVQLPTRTRRTQQPDDQDQEDLKQEEAITTPLQEEEEVLTMFLGEFTELTVKECLNALAESFLETNFTELWAHIDDDNVFEDDGSWLGNLLHQ